VEEASSVDKRKNPSHDFDYIPLVDPQIDDGEWRASKQTVSIDGHEALFAQLIQTLAAERPLTNERYGSAMRQFVSRGLPWLSKSQALDVYRQLCDRGLMASDPEISILLQTKPVRSQAGVTVVTVLTKPYPSGAQRAERHAFDPYNQTAARIQVLEQIGHPAEKIELLILGGTWSSYRRDYQEWFVKRCLDAMNGLESETLLEAQERNAVGQRRNVGLVVETRQDHIDAEELRWLRHLGVTKVQVGVQSMDDRILEMNNRGHDVASTRHAFRLLRLAGFKIHAHWMPNLLGATGESDRSDFGRLWDDPAIRPDELKIYPCMLLENAEMYEFWQKGEYSPYTEGELIELLIDCKLQVPGYVRLNRIIRDIPTTRVVEGNRKANLRQIVQEEMARRGQQCGCIRCREVRRDQVRLDELQLHIESYETDATSEQFLSYEMPASNETDRRIAGFLRLSLPHANVQAPLPELSGHAMIREVHIYGPALLLGDESQGDAQHIGLGTRLILKAKEIAKQAGFDRIAVISAIGTRGYYRKHGFGLEGLYMTAELR
jgi:elongator complex protein 3